METLDILTNSTLDSSSSPRGTSISNEAPRLGFDMAPAQACQPPIPHDIDWESNYELGLPDFPDLQPKQSLDSMAATLDLTDFTPPQQHSPLSVSPEIKPPSEQPDPDPQPQPLLHVSRSRSSRCPVCRKHITRDMSRHLRTHEPVSRFKCVYPREMCIHKTGQFNRPSPTPVNATADSNARRSSGSTRTFCQTTARRSAVSTSTMYTRRPA
ncbi:hypothetical protein KL938_004069 [Ogataea parapolymorpha]|nr:hypothetical protein KL938_004069 [Ogataea parapolymorpha]